MLPKNTKRQAVFVLSIFAAVIALLVVPQAYARTAPWQALLSKQGDAQTPEGALKAAWERLSATDGYGFTTQVSQETAPAPLLANAGRSSKVASLYLEGDINKIDDSLSLRLWDGVQAAYDKAEALEVRIEGDLAFGRTGNGEWEEVDNVGALVAPGLDVAAYLVGARHVSNMGVEKRDVPIASGGIETREFSKYRFVLNGAAVSEYTNAQINAVLKERGELPHGLSLQTGNVFDDADGIGELWVDAQGLPYRLKINLEFPQKAGDGRVTAEIVTDFQDVRLPAGPAGQPVSAGLARIATAVGSITWDRTGLGLLSFVALVGLALFIVRTRRKPLAYGVIAVFMIGQMALSPLASVAQAAGQEAQIERFLTSRGIALSSPGSVTVKPAADESPSVALDSTFDTTRSPLERGQQAHTDQQALVAAAAPAVEAQAAFAPGAIVDTDKDDLEDSKEAGWGAIVGNPDTDGDGLKDGQEAELCDIQATTVQAKEDTTCAHPAKADTDSDGLSDGQEFLYLGTQANSKDSDRDGIDDRVEVEGYGDPKWYTDPRNPDTDDDGLPDGKECPAGCPDTDGDGLADVLDDDSDADGFFDTVDSAPTKSLGTVDQPQFHGANPFELRVQNAQPNRKLFVDFQVRPDKGRLAYPTSVLDWPTGDTGGQVQRRLDTTFADVWKSGDPALANGDMRVVPMLELAMNSATAPLPRANATFSTTLVARTPLGNVQLIDNKKANRVDIRLSALDKQNGETFSLSVNAGSCQASAPIIGGVFADVDGQQTKVLDGRRLNMLASGGHVLVLDNGSTKICVPVGVAPENTPSLPFFFQRPQRSIGTVEYTQTGADVKVDFHFQSATPTYELAVREGRCDARGAQVFSATNLRDGDSSRLIPAQFLTRLADSRHIMTLKESTGPGQAREVICQPLPNLVNGTASQTTMIDQAFLAGFSVTVHEADENGNLIAYVPATTVVDAGSGRTAGFGGRMAFDTAFGTSVTADVRLVWHVQVLSDFCTNPPSDFMPGAGDEQERLAVWCSSGANQLQVVHQYADEGWSLAGLSVREDHSLKVAALFEDPDHDANPASDDRLWHLADGLSDAFLDGRDCAAGTGASNCDAASSDGSRDLTVQQVYERFRQGSPVTDPTLTWGLNDGVLDARLYSADSSIGFGNIVEKDIPALLDQTFLDGSGTTRATAPLILFAGEETFRATELDLAGYSTVAGDRLTVNFSNGIGLQPVTVTTLNWKPYQRVQVGAGNQGKWQAYPLGDYWELLESRLAAAPAFSNAGEEGGDLIQIAQTRIAQVYFTSLYGGQSRLVQVGGQVVQPQPVESVSDAARQQRFDDAESNGELIEAGGLILNTLNPVVSSLAKQYYDYTQVLKPLLRRNNLPLPNFGPKALLKIVGATIKDKTKSNWSNFLGDAVQTRGTKGKSGVRIGALVAGLTIASTAAGQKEGKVTFGSVAAATLNVIDVATNVQSLIKTVNEVRAAGSATPLGQGAAAAARVSKSAGELAGAVALLVGEAVAWGAIIYTMATSNLAAFGVAANELAAKGLGSSFAAVALLALALTGPYGAIAAAVIAVIDSLIALACGFIPTKTVEANVGVQWFCKGISGILAEAVSWVIYAHQDMVTLSDPHRLQIVRFSPALMDPSTGFITGAKVKVDLRLQNTLEVPGLPTNAGALYGWQYTEDELKTSSFKYDIVAMQEGDDEKELHNEVHRKSDEALWQRVTTAATDTRYSMTRDVATRDVSDPYTNTVRIGSDIGLNQPVDALLAEGYAIPMQECIVVPVPFGVVFVPVPICWVRERRDTSYTGLGIEFDVFPDTLADFMQMTATGDGIFAQAWGQQEALKLPALKDADGDGLPASTDANDNAWDSDGDLISDGVERERGSLANSLDSDADNAPDWKELLRKTDPGLADSDGDGLTDGDEAKGWAVTYRTNPLARTNVSADPLRPDADDDGLLDARENAFGFNPYVVSDRNALDFETRLSEPYAPDLILSLDEPDGVSSYHNSADTLGETTVVCKNDKQVGYNVFVDLLSGNMGSNSTPGDLTLSVNGVAVSQAIKLPASGAFENVYSVSIPIAAEQQAEGTSIHWSLTHSGGLQFAADGEYTIGDHVLLSPYAMDFNGPGGAKVQVAYRITKEDGHCPISGLGGYYGHAVKFDGVGDALVVSGNADLGYLARQFAVSAWIRPDHVNGEQIIVSTHREVRGQATTWLEFGLSGSELYFRYKDQSNNEVTVTSAGAGLTPGAWAYVRLEMENPNFENGTGTVRLIHGGTVLTSQGVTDLPERIGSSDALFVGGHPNAINEIEQPFAGMLDEIVLIALPEGSPLSAATTGLPDARYNPNDGILARNQTVGVQIGLGSRLLDREIRGYHTVDFPSAVFANPDARTELFLPPGQPPVNKYVGLATVKPDAPAGDYELTQSVGAAVTIPAGDLWIDPSAGAVYSWNDIVELDGEHDVDQIGANVALLGDFTLSAWIKPGAPENQRRGILGQASHTATGYPSLELQNNRLWFGYGDGSAWREVQSPQTLTASAWNFVTVAYKRSTKTATFYINATGLGDGKDGILPGNPPSTTNTGFFIGRSSNQATVKISQVHTVCEYDYGAIGEYDLLKSDRDGTTNVIKFDGTDDHIENNGGAGWTIPITDFATFTMCEDDDNNRNDCADGDEQMGSFSISATQAAIASQTVVTMTDRPEDPSCSFSAFFGWPETAEISYTFENQTLPFIGGIQKVRIFNQQKTQSEVDALRRGVTYAADFRLDELPGSAKFADFSSFHEATCIKAVGTCPLSGVSGRDEQAVNFDGVNDYLVADSVSTAVLEDNTTIFGNPELTFGAWVKPESVSGTDAVLAFNTAGGGNRNLLMVRADVPGFFKAVYYDDAIGYIVGTTPLALNEWHFLAVTIKGDGAGELWANDRGLGQFPHSEWNFTTSVRPAADGKFSIGQEWDGAVPTDYFDGSIDRVFVTKDTEGGALTLEQDRAPVYSHNMEDVFYSSVNSERIPDNGVRGGSVRFEHDTAYSTFATLLNSTGDLRNAFARLSWTVAIWVKPEQLLVQGAPNWEQPIWSFGNDDKYLQLVLKDGKPVVSTRTGGVVTTAAASQALVPNVWQQIIVRRQDSSSQLSIFINGAKSNVTNSFPGTDFDQGLQRFNPTMAFSHPENASRPFKGSLDELIVYKSDLTDREVREQYNRQNAWMEDQEKAPLTVSVEPPQVTLPITKTYFAQNTVWVPIETKGKYAPVVRAELLIQGIARASAVAELNAEPGTTWLAPFAPILSERDYFLQARATDKVGNQGPWSAAKTVYVDGTAPGVTLIPVIPQPATLKRSPTATDSFVMPLRGTVSDPLLKDTSIPGSGVAFVEITVYNTLSKQAMAGAQRAAVNGSSWSVDYLIPAESLTGQYVVDVVAEDNVGNRTPSVFASLAADLAASQTVLIDTTAPQSTITAITATSVQAAEAAANCPLSCWIGPDTTISGSVDETPATAVEHDAFAGVASVEMALTPLEATGSALRNAPLPESAVIYLPLDESSLVEGSDDTAFGDVISGKSALCSGSECPISGAAGKAGQALMFDDLDDQLTIADVGGVTIQTNSFTLAAWVRPNADTAHRRILMTGDATGGNGFGFGLDGNSALMFTAFGVSDYYAPYDFAPNRWYHVAVAVDFDGNPSFFVNGRPLGMQTAAGQIVADPDGKLVIGRDGDGARFNGRIDEVAVFFAPLTAAQIAGLMGDGPSLHIPFDERSVFGNASLADATGLGSSGLRTSAGEIENGAVQGIVGTNALDFSSLAGESLVITTAPGTMPLGNDAHTIAGWFKVREQAPGSPSRFAVYGNGAAQEIIDFYVDSTDAYVWAGSFETGWVLSDFAGNIWQHFAITYDGSTYTTWLNGVKGGSNAIGPFALSGALTITLENFEGELDDLQVVRRSLSAEEITSLAATGWSQAALEANALEESAPNIETTNWSASPPAGLEGYYQLNTRATDSLGNYVSDPDTGAEWRGTVDTLSPRSRYATSEEDGHWTYTFTATDFNLKTETLGLPVACNGNTALASDSFRSPWYLSLSQQSPENENQLNQRVYSLQATCTVAQPLADGVFSVCDVAGNCAALNWDGTPAGGPVLTDKLFLPFVNR